MHKYVYTCVLYGTRTFIYEALEFAKAVEDKKDGSIYGALEAAKAAEDKKVGGGGEDNDVCMS
jgi:hypothetical protein